MNILIWLRPIFLGFIILEVFLVLFSGKVTRIILNFSIKILNQKEACGALDVFSTLTILGLPPVVTLGGHRGTAYVGMEDKVCKIYNFLTSDLRLIFFIAQVVVSSGT